MHTGPRKHYFKDAFQLIILVLLVLFAFNYQTILDQYALHTFQPSPAMAAIGRELAMTDQAKAIFYRSKAQIDTKAPFNTDCDTKPHELELGCYFQGRIYVLQIDNAKLAPEMETVTAHELLHAVWSRMSKSEQDSLSKEIERVYKIVATTELKQRMSDYAVSEPGEQDNELHSILGTEFANLSPVLEQHYAKYFTDRGVIVAAHQAYQGVFDSQRQALDNELAQIRSEKGQLGVLNRQMDSYKAAQQIAAYNALVPRQNALVEDINKRINDYSAAVAEYNALSKSLDSSQITDTEAPAR